MFRIALICAATLISFFPAHAEWAKVADRWEKYSLTPLQRDWFSKLRPGEPGRSAVPCCNTADGVPAEDWERRETLDTDDGDDDNAGTSHMATHYWVEIDGKWLKVPDEAVITTQGNPVGVPIVWFYNGGSGIRCFVPGPEN